MKMKSILLFLSFILFLASHSYASRETLKGSGNIKTEKRTVDSFNSISVSRAIKVFVTQGPQSQLTLEADDNILPYIKTEVSNNRLKIYLPENVDVKSHADMKVSLTVPQLVALKSTTSSTIESTSNWDISTIELSSTTAGEIKIDLKAQLITAKATTAAKIELKGETQNLNVSLTTSAELDAADLQASKAHFSLTTGSEAEIEVTEELSYTLTTGAELSYKGSPHITKASVTTGGRATNKK